VWNVPHRQKPLGALVRAGLGEGGGQGMRRLLASPLPLWTPIGISLRKGQTEASFGDHGRKHVCIESITFNVMLSHMKLTGGGGMASYDMTDDRGALMPIGYGCYTNRENPEKSRSRFFLHGAAADSVELRAAWPAYFQLLHR